jgi:hypothetical protein
MANAYLESKKAEAKEFVDGLIEIGMKFSDSTRENVVAIVKDVVARDCSKLRIECNSLPQFSTDSIVTDKKDLSFLYRLANDYAQTL